MRSSRRTHHQFIQRVSKGVELANMQDANARKAHVAAMAEFTALHGGAYQGPMSDLEMDNLLFSGAIYDRGEAEDRFGHMAETALVKQAEIAGDRRKPSQRSHRPIHRSGLVRRKLLLRLILRPGVSGEDPCVDAMHHVFGGSHSSILAPFLWVPLGTLRFGLGALGW